MKPEQGVALVISAPSGTGKSSITKELIKRDSRCVLSVSATTRKPRSGETDGVEYFFRTEEEFLQMQNDGALVEWAEFAGHLYGTPRAFVEKQKAHKKIVLLDIDVQGAAQVRRTMPDAVTIFLAPPSKAVIEERLRGRMTETEEAIQQRLARVNEELASANLYEYLVVNDTVDKAVESVLEIVEAEWRRTSRMNLDGDWCPA